MPHDRRYGPARVRKGIHAFLLGKAFSAIAGAVTLTIVVRVLPIEAFGAYAVLTGFVGIATALAGFGLLHVALRYVPELYAQDLDASLGRLLTWTFGIRTIVLAVILALAAVASRPIAEFFGLGAWEHVFRFFLYVVFLRVTGNFLFQILEGLLHQGRAQFGFQVTTTCRLVLVAVLASVGLLSLESLILVEIIAELLGLMVLAGLLRKTLKEHAPLGKACDAGWIAENRDRIVHFGVTAWLQEMTILLYGSAPNRLAAGKLLATQSLASFGLAQSIADLIGRYLPARLFQGLVRPLLVVRYSQSGDFDDLARIANLIAKLNFLVLGAGLAILLPTGTALVDSLSDGKYGELVNALLILVIGVLALETVQLLLNMLIGAVERNDIATSANLVISASLLLAVALAPVMGALAVPVANITGLAISNAAAGHMLRRDGFRFRVEGRAVACIGAAVLLGAAGGMVARFGGWNAWPAALAAVLIYAMAIPPMRLFSRREREMLKKLRAGDPSAQARD